MEELMTQFGSAAAMLVGLVAAVVQQFKRSATIEKWQEKLPIYQILSLGLGVVGAFQFAIPNPVFAGLFIGAAAMGAFDTVKKVKIPKKTTSVIPILLFLLLLLFVGCAEQNLRPTVWALSGSNVQEVDTNVQYLGRVGLEVDEVAPLEIGLVIDWWEQKPSQSYGLYALKFLLSDPNGLLGLPYVGAGTSIYVAEGRSGLYGFFVGTVHTIKGIPIVTEYQYRRYGDSLRSDLNKEEEDESRIFAGLRYKF